MWTCLCLHISAQVLTKPGFQQIVNKAKIPPVHCICPRCLSVFCFGLFILLFFFSLQCVFLLLCSEQHLFCSLLSFVHQPHGLLSGSCAVSYFVPGFPPCFLSSEPCFGTGQEVVFKLATFWSLLICTLGGAFLLRVIWISLQGENQESRKLENKWTITMVETKASNSSNLWIVSWMNLITKLRKEKRRKECPISF